jgi:hypothetical protein
LKKVAKTLFCLEELCHYPFSNHLRILFENSALAPNKVSSEKLGGIVWCVETRISLRNLFHVQSDFRSGLVELRDSALLRDTQKEAVEFLPDASRSVTQISPARQANIFDSAADI